MVDPHLFMQIAAEKGFLYYSGVPCSILKPFINHAIESKTVQYISVVNEGDGVAVSAGLEFAGKKCVVLLQNSGLGNCVNPLTSLIHAYRIPILLIITLRGNPKGERDEPQHSFMGSITTDMLELLQIPWEFFPENNKDIQSVLLRASNHMQQHQAPFALVMKKGDVKSDKTSVSGIKKSHHQKYPIENAKSKTIGTRAEILKIIQQNTENKDLLLSTTGYTSRELYGIGDRANQFYMVGSMGCVSSFGLGIALGCPGKRIIVIDGDGSLLMRMGALASIGYERPDNLIHILLDNEMYESTGGQPSVSGAINFSSIAHSCGYGKAVKIQHMDELVTILKESKSSSSFFHIKTNADTAKKLPRPTITPEELAKRCRNFLQENKS